MAITVLINKVIQWDGTRGSLHYAFDSDGDEVTNESLVDISADLAGDTVTSIKLRSVDVLMYGNFITFLEFDATTDQEIDRFETQAADVSQQFVRDYTDMPNGGKLADDVTATGFTGDLTMTTTGMASGDGVNLLITFERSSTAVKTS